MVKEKMTEQVEQLVQIYHIVNMIYIYHIYTYMLAPPPGPTFWDEKLFFYLLLNTTYPFYRIIYIFFIIIHFSTPQISK